MEALQGIGFENPYAIALLALAPLVLAAGRRAMDRWLSRRLRPLHPLARYAAPLRSRAAARARWARVCVALEAIAVALLLLSIAGPYYTVVEEVAGAAHGVHRFEIGVKPTILLVIDVSGSMAGEKLLEAKNAVRRVAELLQGKVGLGLIAFSDRIVAAVPPGAPLGRLLSTVDMLNASGGTMYSYPLSTALGWLEPYRYLGIGAAVVFVSDGLPADEAEFRPLLERFADLGIPLYTVFIGTDRKGEALLAEMARATGGVSTTAARVGEIVDTITRLAEEAWRRVAEESVEVELRTATRVRVSLAPYIALAAAYLALAAAAMRYRLYGTVI